MGWTLSRRVWLVLGAATLIVVGLLYANSRRPAPRVLTVRVTRGNLNSSSTSNGKVEPVAPYSLRARFDGFVDRVVAVEGQKVRAGRVLLVLNAKDVRAQLDQTKAQLASEEDNLRAAMAGGRADQAARLTGDLRTAEAQRNLLQKQKEALAKLVAEKAATQQELETNRAEFARADAQ